MRIESEFHVNAPVEKVWEYLLNVDEVVTCVPGAEIVEKISEDEYLGHVTLKVGPLGLNLQGTAVIESRDEAARAITISGSAKDKQGKGGANAQVVARLTDSPEGGTQVAIEQDLRVTGRIAQFGRGVMKDVSQRLSRDFAQRLEAKIAADSSAGPGTAAAGQPAPQDTAAAPVGGLSLLFWAMARAVGRILRRITGRESATAR
ncbi:SRPBCC family protein [Streptomyces sp. NPDC005727]|uniref:SRPBCC family protein n=1 Tax=Streptomyces sp. NPDC005727 TaxID=3157053 RepID=UPI0033D4575C